MGRFVTYSDGALAAAGRRKPAADSGTGGSVVRGQHRSSDQPDDYGERLVKFIPAEVISFFLAVSLIAHGSGEKWAVLVLAVVMQLGLSGFAYLRAEVVWWNIALSAVALLAWIGGTSDYLTDLWGVSPSMLRIVMVFVVFAVPAVDQFLDQRTSG